VPSSSGSAPLVLAALVASAGGASLSLSLGAAVLLPVSAA
jgi:hypothetical protein